jgi:hypothetical protein
LPFRSLTSQLQLTRSGTTAPTVRDSFSTHARVAVKSGPCAIGTQIWMPRRPVTFGREKAPTCSRAVRCSRARASTSSQVVFSPGSRSISAHEGRSGRSTVDVQACHSSAPKLAAHTSAAGSSTTRYVRVSPGSASGLSQRGSQSGAWCGSALCQKPLVCAPFG